MTEMTEREKTQNRLEAMEIEEGYGNLSFPLGGGVFDKPIKECTPGDVAYYFAKKQELRTKLESMPDKEEKIVELEGQFLVRDISMTESEVRELHEWLKASFWHRVKRYLGMGVPDFKKGGK